MFIRRLNDNFCNELNKLCIYLTTAYGEID